MNIDDIIEDYEGELKFLIHNKYDVDTVKRQFFNYQKYYRHYQTLSPPIKNNYDELFKIVTQYIKKYGSDKTRIGR